MKVLYALYEPDTLSESYIRTEMDWMESKGVEISVWGHMAHISTYNDPRAEKLVGGPFQEALARFKPDRVHTHWLMAAKMVVDAVEAAGLPLTIRGHSFEFTPEDVARLEARPCVKKIWLFPHFMLPGMLKKAVPLPVCFDERRYKPGGPRNPRKVFRASAGVEGKGLEELLEVASACPDHEFVLAVTRATHLPSYPDRLASLAPPNLQVRVNLQHDEVAGEIQAAAIYLRNHDPGSHPYGMPISAAEAMGCGSVLVARRAPAVEAYLGEAALYYDGVDEAVALLQATLDWSAEEWERRAQVSLDRSLRFRTDVVLPQVLEEWNRR